MRQIFKADTGFFSDLSGDPNIAIHIQELVQEYKSVQNQRRQGIKESIKKLGERALPGIIQSTYTLLNQIQSDKSLDVFLKSTIVSACNNNDSARIFLMRHGIAKNPFKESREWLIDALLAVQNPNKDNAITRFLTKDKLDSIVIKSSPELKEFLPLWLQYDRDNAYQLCHDSMIRHLKNNTLADLKEAIKLLRYMIDNNIDLKTEISAFFANISWGVNDYDRPSAYENFMDSLNVTPFSLTAYNFKDFIDALDFSLSESSHPKKRNRYIEKSFISSVRVSIEKEPALLKAINEYIANKHYIVIYWFQAIWSNGYAERLKNNEKIFTGRVDWQVTTNYMESLFIQYFFMSKKKNNIPGWMHHFVLSNKDEYSNAYGEAEDEVDGIKGGGGAGDGETGTGGGGTGVVY